MTYRIQKLNGKYRVQVKDFFTWKEGRDRESGEVVIFNSETDADKFMRELYGAVARRILPKSKPQQDWETI